MTVAELLDRISAVYPGATPEALKTFKPVFHARLRKHEGDALEESAIEVLATFKPKFDQKFPIPADFEKHLPASHPKIDEASIRDEMEARRTRRSVSIQIWMQGQGAKIREARPGPVYGACLAMAMDHCSRPSWRVLSAAQINECEMRALSQARVKMFGKLPPTNLEWDEQLEQVRIAWAQPKQEGKAA